MRLTIVSSHFNEDLSWLVDQKDFDYRIYTKNVEKCKGLDKTKVFECVNKGLEASSYISYIIDNYENLPDYVAFIHGHSHSYHQTDHTMVLVNSALDYINTDSNIYYSINRKDWRNVFGDDIYDWSGNWKLIKENYEYLNIGIPMPKRLECTASAQFIVSRKNILLNDVNDYKNILKWLESTDLDSSISGRIMEHLWCYIMTHEEIEKKYEHPPIWNRRYLEELWCMMTNKIEKNEAIGIWKNYGLPGI